MVDSTGSTNADLLGDLEAGRVEDRSVLRAQHQSAGRGRLDRRWDAPAGSNLLVSLGFVEVPAAPAALMQAIGVAAIDGVESLIGRGLGDRLALKWPNDLLLDDRKLAGVLAQRGASGAVVVGMGLNVGWAPETGSSLAGTLDLAVEPDELLDHVLVALDRHLAASDEDQHERYVARLGTIGRVVRVELPAADDLVGEAVGVDRNGRLLVDAADGGQYVIDVGDIVHLRTPDIDQR